MDSTTGFFDLNAEYVGGYNEDEFQLVVIDDEDSTPEDADDGEKTNNDDVVDGEFETANGDQDIEADIDVENVTEPFKEMKFDSAEMMLQFMHDYGKAKGFQIRIRSTEKKKKLTEKPVKMRGTVLSSCC